jgi:hypothetical protein
MVGKTAPYCNKVGQNLESRKQSVTSTFELDDDGGLPAPKPAGYLCEMVCPNMALRLKW